MTIGPEPMIMIFRMSVRLGMIISFRKAVRVLSARHLPRAPELVRAREGLADATPPSLLKRSTHELAFIIATKRSNRCRESCGRGRLGVVLNGEDGQFPVAQPFRVWS